MHSILALSAFHLSWTTGNQDTKHLAYHHRGIAIKGLQVAIGSFSNKNCEAILAASILLSWGATEWQVPFPSACFPLALLTPPQATLGILTTGSFYSMLSS